MAIARTLLKDNDILIFDDSLSAVDTETDRSIREALQEARKELDKSTTTFIISHRLTTLAEADVIVVMQNGEISQMGTHEEARQPGRPLQAHLPDPGRTRRGTGRRGVKAPRPNLWIIHYVKHQVSDDERMCVKANSIFVRLGFRDLKE